MKKHLATFVYAILAGVCIGLGGTVFLRLKDAFTGGNVVGALLFAIGLFAICTRGYNMFTGKACYLFDNKPGYVVTLLVIWLGNLVGTGFLAPPLPTKPSSAAVSSFAALRIWRC